MAMFSAKKTMEMNQKSAQWATCTVQRYFRHHTDNVIHQAQSWTISSINGLVKPYGGNFVSRLVISIDAEVLCSETSHLRIVEKNNQPHGEIDRPLKRLPYHDSWQTL